MRSVVLLTLTLALTLGLLAGCANPAQQMQARIEAQMAAPDRHEFDLPRDAGRKPFATFQFLGIQAGMTALDVGAYAGYTTEMLAAAVGPQGQVYSHNTERVLTRYAEGYYQRTMTERLANDRLPNVVLHIREYDDLGLAGQVDVAFLGNLLHDFYHRDGRDSAIAFLREIGSTLKTGGVLGITDHVGKPGANNAALHRIDPEVAKALLLAAGFSIAGESDLFANSADDHSLMVYNDLIYRQTDRFFFKAVKN